MALGDGIRRDIATISDEERALFVAAIRQLDDPTSAFLYPNNAGNEAADASGKSAIAGRDEEFRRRLKELQGEKDRASGLKATPPGKIAWATDVTATPPETHLLVRGDYAKPGDVPEAEKDKYK